MRRKRGSRDVIYPRSRFQATTANNSAPVPKGEEDPQENYITNPFPGERKGEFIAPSAPCLKG